MGLFGKDDSAATGDSLDEARRARAEEDQSSSGGDETAKALAQARGVGSGTEPKQRKRRTKKSDSGGGVPADDEQARKDFAALMEVETFEMIVRFPADVGLMLTGREHFRLADHRVKPVALQAKIAASYWMMVDPKYLSLVCFGLGMVTLYAPIVAAELAARRGHAEAE